MQLTGLMLKGNGSMVSEKRPVSEEQFLRHGLTEEDVIFNLARLPVSKFVPVAPSGGKHCGEGSSPVLGYRACQEAKKIWLLNTELRFSQLLCPQCYGSNHVLMPDNCLSYSTSTGCLTALSDVVRRQLWELASAWPLRTVVKRSVSRLADLPPRWPQCAVQSS